MAMDIKINEIADWKEKAGKYEHLINILAPKINQIYKLLEEISPELHNGKKTKAKYRNWDLLYSNVKDTVSALKICTWEHIIESFNLEHNDKYRMEAVIKSKNEMAFTFKEDKKCLSMKASN